MVGSMADTEPTEQVGLGGMAPPNVDQVIRKTEEIPSIIACPC